MIETERLATRDEYDAMVARMPLEARGQWWPVPWRIATWRERTVKIALWGAESIALLAAIAVAGYVFGGALESYAHMTEIRDRCLKQATTGYEISECEHGRRRPTPDL
jgi:hypothetical protein